MTDGRATKAELTLNHRDSGDVRITADLRAVGNKISNHTVAKIMAEPGLAGIGPRTFKVHTTIVDPTASLATDLVER